MKVAVSGSSGFVGKHVCQLLKQAGHEVVEIDILTGFDLSDKDVICEIAYVDAFIHLANLVYVPASYQDPERFYQKGFP